MKHFFLQTGFQQCWHRTSHAAFRPQRLVFADPQDKNQENAEKHEPVIVTHNNVQDVLPELVKKGMIDDSDSGKALEIFNKGSEKDRKRLVQLLQQGVQGTLTADEFGKFTREALENIREKTDHNDEEEAFVKRLKKGFTSKTGQALQESEAVVTSYLESPDEKNREIANKIKGLKGDFERLHEQDIQGSQKTGEILTRLVKEKKVTSEQAKILMALDFTDDKAISEWNAVMREIKDPAVKSGPIDELLKVKKKMAANEEELLQKKEEMEKLVHQIEEEALNEAEREKTRELLEKSTGLPLKAGKALRFKTTKEKGEGQPPEEVEAEGVIRDVTYEKIEIKDNQGKVVRTLVPRTPVVMIEHVDAETKEIKRTPFSARNFKRWAAEVNATEAIEDEKDLEKAIGQKIQKGDVFEYRDVFDAEEGVFGTEDKTVKIANVDTIQKEIELDHEVMSTPGSTIHKKRFTFGEFAKWFKQNDAVRPIDSIKKLRGELIQHTDTLNEIKKRNPKQFPPIEVKEGEVLQYPGEDGKTFVIKKVTDKKIVLDNGEAFTPAAFLRWIQKNKVEKKDAEAEAKQKTQHIADEAERKAQEEAEKAKAQQEIDDRKKLGEELPPEEAKAKLPSAKTPSKGLWDKAKEMMARIWEGTYFLSFNDLKRIVEIPLEWIKRKQARGQKARVGAVGKKFFGGWGARVMNEIEAEFKGEELHGEEEEVKKQADRMSSMGADEIWEELYSVSDKDVLKAAISVLTKKGRFRWDDPRLWDTFNNTFKGSVTDDKGNPIWVKKETYMDNMAAILNTVYGDGTFREFRAGQDSSYANVKNSFKDMADTLETEPNGLKKAMQKLLYKHLHGKLINSAEYEEYLHYAIEQGRMAFEDKIFFLIMGFGAVSHETGLPILSISAFGRIGALFNQFPVLDFFMTPGAQLQHYDDNGEPMWEVDDKGERKPKKGKAELNNFKKWVKEIAEKDMEKGIYEATGPADYKWGKALTDFVHEEIVWNPAVRNRHEAASSNASRWDKDDMHIFGPMMRESVVAQMLAKELGAKQTVSSPGVKNAMVGFNQFIKVKLDMLERNTQKEDWKAVEEDINDLMGLLRTFIRFDAIVDNRYLHGQEQYTRLSDSDLNSNAGVDSARWIVKHRNEMRQFIGRLAEKFGISEMWNNEVLKRYGFRPPGDLAQKQDNAVVEFAKILEDRILHQRSFPNMARTFLETQKEDPNGVVQGIRAEPETRETREAVEVQAPKKLTPYVPDEIRNQVFAIKELKQELAKLDKKDVSQIRGDVEKRLEEIIHAVEAEDYVPQPDDKKILQAARERLNKKLGEREQLGDLKGNAANDNDQRYRRRAS